MKKETISHVMLVLLSIGMLALTLKNSTIETNSASILETNECPIAGAQIRSIELSKYTDYSVASFSSPRNLQHSDIAAIEATASPLGLRDGPNLDSIEKTQNHDLLGTPIVGPTQSPQQHTFNHWFLLDYWDTASGTSLPQYMSGEFIAVQNTIVGLQAGWDGIVPWHDSILYLPLNVAYGTSSTNCVWFQFDIQFVQPGLGFPYPDDVTWYIWDIRGPGTDEGYWPFGDYHYTEIALDYVPGHEYYFSLTTSGANTVTFFILDRTTGASWSMHDWVWTVPSTSMFADESMFSPASAVEGYTTGSALSDMPFFQTRIGEDATVNRHYPSGIGIPSGVTTDRIEIGASNLWYWEMLRPGALPIPDVFSVSYPASIEVSQSATIDVHATNNGGTAAWQTIAISFPIGQSLDTLTITESDLGNAHIHNPGETVNGEYSRIQVILSQYLIEGSTNWLEGDTHDLKITVKPQSTGSFLFYVKSVAAATQWACNWDPTAGEMDQQVEFVKTYTINVGVSSSSISVSVNPSEIALGGGTQISGTISSPAPGDLSGTVFLQYSTDNTIWNPIDSIFSSPSGEYSYWWTPSSMGTFYIRSYWNGNSNYGGATSDSVTLTVTSGAGILGDHTMCKAVQSEEPWGPIDRTNTFFTDDYAAYSWLHFDGPIYGSHIVHWDWYDPDGSFITDSTATIPDAQDFGGEYWIWYRISSGLLIDGYQSWYASRLGRPFITQVFYDGSFVVSETWQVIKHDSFLSVSLSSNSITYGQSVLVASLLTPPLSDGTATLQYSTDQVSWIDVSSGTPSSGYYSSFWTPPNAGTYYVRAVWSGSPDYYGSTSSTEGLTVNRAPTSLVTLLSSPTITYGDGATITAIMSPALSEKIMVIQFSSDETTWFELISGNTDSAGEYAYIWFPGAGTYYVRSTWSGDANYYGSTSSSEQLIVNKAATSTVCSLSSSIIKWAESVNVTATVSVPVSDGTITLEYMAYQQPWTVMSTGTPTMGSYSYQWTPPANRSYSVRAVWSGNNNYLDSTSLNQGLDVEGTIYVPMEFSQIQDAIYAAARASNAHYIIYVYSGTYNENITISSYNNNLRLTGESFTDTVLNGSISAHFTWGITIENFHVLSGIELMMDSNRIAHNIIEQGLVLTGGRYFPSYWNTIENNTFIGGSRVEYRFGVAIELQGTWENNITGNTIIGAETGIREYVETEPYTVSCMRNTIEKNHLINCSIGVRIYAIPCVEVERGVSLSKILNNSFENNNYGISLDHVTNVTISNNDLYNNSRGVWLYSSSYNLVSSNNITANNNYGIYLDDSSNNTIFENAIIDNSNGVWIYYLSSFNTVSTNNITDSWFHGMAIFGTSNTVSNNNIANNGGDGIGLFGEFNTVLGNNITNNAFTGVTMGWPSHSHNNSLYGNYITNNENGVLVDWPSANNTILENNITANNNYGIFLNSENSTLRGNNMASNGYNFYLLSESRRVNDVDVSNTVDGKPIYYWIGKTDMTVPLDAGYIALIDCTEITVQDLNLTNNGQGLLLANTTNSKIARNNITNNTAGIYLWISHNNTISENTITKNHHGIQLYESKNNNIYENNITNNDNGAFISYSSDNSFYRNNIRANNYCGIRLWDCSNNTFCQNNFVDNSQQVYIDTSGCTNFWDGGYPFGGNYWSDYVGSDLFRGPYHNETGRDGIGDTPYLIDADNIDYYPLMKPYGGPYDIGILSLNSSKTVVCQGYSLVITVEVLNYGIDDETFDVSVYANATIIHTQTITLTSRNSTVIILTWNTAGFTYGNYTVSAYAEAIMGETETYDNTYIDGTVTVAIVGDVNGDGIVNVMDLTVVSLAYGNSKGEPYYNPEADINEDEIVDMRDLFLVARHLGESAP